MVALDLKESDVLAAATNEAITHNFIKAQRDEVKVAKLACKELDLLELGQVLERVD